MAGGGCATDRPPPGRADVLAEGQPWRQAVAVAYRGRYTLYDLTGEQTLAPQHGFCLRLADGRGLIIGRRGETDAVGQIELVGHWAEPVAAHVYHGVRSIRLPPAVSRGSE